MDVLVFDIETVPDVELGRRLHGFRSLSDAQVGKAMHSLRRQDTGSEFLSIEQQRIVAISCLLRRCDGEGLKLWSLGEEGAGEAELVERFFDGIERYGPVLVSWNGCGFDLPVLHFRALAHGVPAPRYWETGDNDSSFRWNNYLNRHHARHLDLMDVLGGRQPRGRVALAHAACLLGLPGKLGFDGSQVFERWLAGDLVRIRRYCETDVLNTYLIWLRFELMRGRLSREAHAAELQHLREYLGAGTEPHHAEFLAAWPAAAGSR